MTEPPTIEQRRARNFLRRSRAAQEKRHLPTLDELLLDMPWFGGKIEDDAREFAERLLVRLSRKPATDESLESVKQELICLTMDPELPEFRSAAKQIRDFNRTRRRQDFKEYAIRCDLYAACFGCVESGLRVAAEALALVERDTPGVGEDEVASLIRNALGWLRIADIYSRRGSDRRYDVASAGEGLLQLIGRTGERGSGRAAPGLGEYNERDVAIPMSAPSKTKKPQSLTGGGGSVVVFSSIGNRDTPEGRRVSMAFSSVLGRPLPLVACPDLVPVYQALRDEYPYAATVIETVLRDVAGRPHVGLRPVVLVGRPGTGKSRFARRAMELLGVPTQQYHCGGVADAALAGTARRWSSGEPCLPVSLIREYACASPAIILDEIEKVGTSRHNGNVLDALLALLERETASTWHDPYLEAPVDLSHVIWLATANSIEGLPSPLRDRCRILEYPGPDHRHLPMLASAIVSEILVEQGMDRRWASPMTGEEIGALAKAWEGGSIRVLRRFVEGVLDARAQIEPRH